MAAGAAVIALVVAPQSMVLVAMTGFTASIVVRHLAEARRA